MKFARIVSVFTALVFTLGASSMSYAQLSAGDIMFVGFNADNPDGFAIVALNAIPAGSVIYFSDNNWNGTAFATTEGVLAWTVGAAIPAGNVVVFNNTFPGPPVVNFGSAAVAGNFDLAGGGESLYCYLNAVPTVFLSAISNNNFGANTLTGTGLSSGINAVSFTGNLDVLVYNNSISPCTISIVACAAQIANTSNWITDDGTGNQATDGFFADFPASVLGPPTISVLPIELLSFEAFTNEQHLVQLIWQTSSERNNDYFEIEKRASKIISKELPKSKLGYIERNVCRCI